MLILLVLAALVADASAAATPQTPATLLDGLAGSCWQTDMSGGLTDTHCFTLSAGGKLGLDVHKVQSGDGKVVYEGVTDYRPDGKTAQVDFGYANSDGDLMLGTASRAGDTLSFALTMPDGTPASLTWQITADGYDVTTPQGTRHFRRVGPSPEGGL